MDTHPVFRGLKMHADHELELIRIALPLAISSTASARISIAAVGDLYGLSLAFQLDAANPDRAGTLFLARLHDPAPDSFPPGLVPPP